MRITESQLRRIVRSSLLERDEGPFGEHLFGYERSLPSEADPELNTDEEDDLADAMRNHYTGEMAALTPWISQLADLESRGLYTDVLSPPMGAKYAYRMMNNVGRDVLAKILGREPQSGPTDGLHEEPGGTFLPSRVGGRPHYSWTIDYGMFEKMLEDWGTLTDESALRRSGETQFLVFLRAPIAGNRFLLNPGATEPLADDYAYQDEVLSVGPIKCDHVWYVPINPESIAPGGSAWPLDRRALWRLRDIESSRKRESARDAVLRRIVREALLSERKPPPPDEPDVSPTAAMGQYFLPGLRSKEGYVDPSTGKPIEKNTKLEDALEVALETHYGGGGSGLLAAVWPRLWKMSQSGLYTKWLVPKKKYAYRWMTGVPPALAAKILGVDMQTLRSKPLQPLISETAPNYTAREAVASWTVDPAGRGMFLYANSRLDPDTVNILLEARVTPDGSGGQFLINTANFNRDFMRDLMIDFDSEQEIIGYGPIVITRAAWFYTPKEGIAVGKKGITRDMLPHAVLPRALGI